VLDLYVFVLVDPLMMALRCRNMQQFDKLYCIVCTLLQFIDCMLVDTVNWSLVLMEERRPRFANGILRKTFRPKREEVTGAWR